MLDIKTIVFGIDGGSFDIIKPLIKKGKLPTFKKLIEKGSHGTLESTIPPFTVPAWPCFFTGKNPGKTSVFSFVRLKNRKLEFSSLRDIRSKKIWDYIQKSISINIPMTYPPESIEKGWMISGMMSPSKKNFINPPELKNEIDPDYVIEALPYRGTHKQEFINDVNKTFDKRVKLMFQLMEKEHDLLLILFRATDLLQHFCWDEKEIADIYEKIDRVLSQILKEDKYDNIFIISDHGFEGLKDKIYPNKVLADNGYLKFNTKKTVVTKKGIDKFVRTFKMQGVVTSLPESIKKRARKLPETREKSMEEMIRTDEIDWKNTTALFFDSTNGIYIFDKSKKQEIKNVLKKELGEINIFEREEIYAGSYVDGAPDLILAPENGTWTFSNLTNHNPKWRGIHNKNGILIAFGKNIENKKEIQNAKLIDIVPTILKMHKIRVPEDMDGRPLTIISSL